MNVLSAFGLYLGLFFVMIALALFHVVPVNYLGGIIIALFIGGLCYAWLNAWRQTDRIVRNENPRLSLAKEASDNEGATVKKEIRVPAI